MWTKVLGVEDMDVVASCGDQGASADVNSKGCMFEDMPFPPAEHDECEKWLSSLDKLVATSAPHSTIQRALELRAKFGANEAWRYCVQHLEKMI